MGPGDISQLDMAEDCTYEKKRKINLALVLDRDSGHFCPLNPSRHAVVF